MRVGYYFRSNSGEELTNLSQSCLECVYECESDMEKCMCNVYNEERRRGKIDLDCGTVYVCTSEAVESNRLFKEKRRLVVDVLPRINDERDSIKEDEMAPIRRHLHNLKRLNTESLQSIWSNIPKDKLTERSAERVLDNIEEIILSDPRSAANLLLRLLKNEKMVKTEFTLFDKIQGEETVTTGIHNIHKLILSVLNGFWYDFMDMGVDINIDNTNARVLVDYGVLSAVLVNLFDNATKYIRQNSELRIEFREKTDVVFVDLKMISLEIKDVEKESIWSEGYSGILPRELNEDGSGIGLHRVKELLQLIDGGIVLKTYPYAAADDAPRDHSYGRNIFRVMLPTP